MGGQAPGRADWRQPLVGACDRRLDALCRTLCAAGRHYVPPRPFVRCAASLLRRRSRHRAEPQAAGAGEGRRSGAADRRAHERDAVAELHAVRHSRSADDIRACASRRRRAWPRLSSGAGDQCLTDGVLLGARRPAAAERHSLAGRERHGACRLPGLDREGDAAAGRGQSRRGHGVVAREFAGRCDHHHWRRQFFRLGASLLSRAKVWRLGRTDLRLHGLRLSRGAGEQDALSRAHGGVRCRRWRFPHDGAGFRHRRAIQAPGDCRARR